MRKIYADLRISVQTDLDICCPLLYSTVYMPLQKVRKGTDKNEDVQASLGLCCTYMRQSNLVL